MTSNTQAQKEGSVFLHIGALPLDTASMFSKRMMIQPTSLMPGCGVAVHSCACGCFHHTIHQLEGGVARALCVHFKAISIDQPRCAISKRVRF